MCVPAHRSRLAVLSAGTALLATLLTGPGDAGAAAPTTTTDVAAAGSGPAGRTYVAVGDSITAGMVQETDSLESPGATSWLRGETAVSLHRVGGWARPGAVTADMRAGFRPVAADVLVLLGGTNDLARGIPWEVTETNLLALATAAGTPDLLLVAIPPADADPVARSAFNARLAVLADRAQWRFTDPWAEVAVGGGWAPGTTVDGIHPTPEVAAAAGRLVGDAVSGAAGRPTAR
jgi:acyl-CoA thioesterase I